MKTVIVFITLACVATAIPTVLRERTRSIEHDGDNSDFKVREKKSPLHDFTQALSSHGQEDKIMQNLKGTEVKVLEKRTPIFKKPIIVKKKFGYHVYRDSEEEMAHADPHENCSKQVKVKLCDNEPDLHKNSDDKMSDHPQGIILEKEMQQSIKMAKDAVENLQRDLWKMEQNSAKLSNSKENLQSDTDLQQDIENARKVLEHIQQNIGNFESIDFQSNTPKTEAIKTIDLKDAERLNQWKEAIENIHKNFEIARNIEDAFKNDAETVHSELKSNEKLEEHEKLVALEHNSEQKSDSVQTVHNLHKSNTLPLVREDKSTDFKHSFQTGMSDIEYQQNDNEHNADMFVSPTNHKETLTKLDSESLISENILKETTTNRFKSSEVLPQLFEIEQMSDNKQNPIVRAASNYEMETQRSNFDDSDVEVQLEGLNKHQQKDKKDININTPLLKASAMIEDNAEKGIKLNDKDITEVKTDLMTPKETLADDDQKNNEQSIKKNSELDTTTKNDLDTQSSDNKINTKDAESLKTDNHFPGNALDLSYQVNKESEPTMEAKQSEKAGDLLELVTTNAPQVNKEDLLKMSNKESELKEKDTDPKKLFLIEEPKNVLEQTNGQSFIHDPSMQVSQEKLHDEVKTMKSSNDDQLIHLPTHTINEHVSARMEKNNNIGLELLENQRLYNSFPTRFISRPPVRQDLIDHSSHFFKTVTETQNLREPLTMRWAQQMRNQDHLSQAVQESQNESLMQASMKSTKFNKQPVVNDNMNMRTIDHNLGQQLADNHELKDTHLMQSFKVASNFQDGSLMTNPIKSNGFQSQMPTMRQQMNTRMPPNQQMVDNREVHDALSMRRSQEIAPKDHSSHVLDTANEFHGEQHMDDHLHMILPTNRFNNHFDSENSHNFMSRMPDHMHIIKNVKSSDVASSMLPTMSLGMKDSQWDNAKSSDMDSSMQPSTQFGVRDPQWGSNSHGMARSGYSSSATGSGPGAVGVFPNANTNCGIPLLLSCSPSVVSGSLAKTHPSPISAPAYRSGNDFSYYMKRDANHIEGLSNAQVQKSTLNNHKFEMPLNNAD